MMFAPGRACREGRFPDRATKMLSGLTQPVHLRPEAS
jgi:hypothetical protein